MSRLKFFFFVFLFSCSSFKQDPQMLYDIRDWNLAGKWVNEAGHFRISCVANFEYYEANTFDNFGMGSSEKGGWIRTLKKNKIITGPVFRITYKINKLPAHTPEGWVMTLNEMEWKREADFPNCP
jgi:hypothetical protein